jgi:DCN1-like protein 1/2
LIIDLVTNYYFYRFFAQNPNASNPASEKAEASLTKLFDKYRGAYIGFMLLDQRNLVLKSTLTRLYTDAKNDEKDTIGIDGTIAYLTELGVNMEDASSIIPLEIVQAPALGEMTKEEFIKGWKRV